MYQLPKNIANRSTVIFFIILGLISIVAHPFALPIIWVIFGSVTVLYFFTYLKKPIPWITNFSASKFTKNLFITALAFRVAWVVFSYFFYMHANGNPFEFESADAMGYHKEALWMLDVLKEGKWNTFQDYYSTRYTDMGYPVYLIIIYSIFGKSIFICRLIKAFLGAATVVLVYMLAKRNFGEKVARLSGFIALLYPNLVYYTGLHVKETEMVFLFMAFTERADFLLRQKKLNIGLIALTLLLGVALYFFRAVLAYSALASVILTLIFSRKEVFRMKKSLLVIMGIVLVLIFLYGSEYLSEALEYWSNRFSNQETSLLHRARTNALARYGSAFIFAPFVLIAPFPTLVHIETQQNHMLLGGAFYIKNVLAYFVILAFYHLYKNKTWKSHVLLITIMISYIAILTMSKFALVERFHLPVLPFHIMFTAYGLSKLSNRNYKSFSYYSLGLALIIIGWNWIKLAGRGLI
jgi:4-amino-4-deoxy-L-arabinose transferase-like glycosyltransferase